MLIQGMPAPNRIIQESVPGKQITLIHIIANPQADTLRKMGLPKDLESNSIAMLSITPRDVVIIAADVAVEGGDIKVITLDRFSGSLIVTGELSAVESSMRYTADFLQNKMGYLVAPITIT